jgi:hypothetical protein
LGSALFDSEIASSIASNGCDEPAPKALGLSVSDNLLTLADEVIEVRVAIVG